MLFYSRSDQDGLPEVYNMDRLIRIYISKCEFNLGAEYQLMALFEGMDGYFRLATVDTEFQAKTLLAAIVDGIATGKTFMGSVEWLEN